jgi:hypothetical protein
VNEYLDLIARIFVIIGIPAGAVWALYKTQIAPAKIREREVKLEADLAALEDSREHKQTLETEQIRLGALSQSWANEKLFEEAHENSEFLRQQMTKNLSDIQTEQRQLLQRMAQIDSKITLLIGVIAELNEVTRKNRAGSE